MIAVVAGTAPTWKAILPPLRRDLPSRLQGRAAQSGPVDRGALDFGAHPIIAASTRPT
jgi:hypothetical protein